MTEPFRLDRNLVLNLTGDTIDALLQRGIQRRGIEAVARFVAAEDESVDDEVEFWSADGTLRHPVSVQLTSGCRCVVVYGLDAEGEVESATHGILHTSFDGTDNLVYELAKALRANPPVPPGPSESKVAPR